MKKPPKAMIGMTKTESMVVAIATSPKMVATAYAEFEMVFTYF